MPSWWQWIQNMLSFSIYVFFFFTTCKTWMSLMPLMVAVVVGCRFCPDTALNLYARINVIIGDTHQNACLIGGHWNPVLYSITHVGKFKDLHSNPWRGWAFRQYLPSIQTLLADINWVVKHYHAVMALQKIDEWWSPYKFSVPDAIRNIVVITSRSSEYSTIRSDHH